jgi:hypothetical protein
MTFIAQQTDYIFQRYNISWLAPKGASTHPNKQHSSFTGSIITWQHLAMTELVSWHGSCHGGPPCPAVRCASILCISSQRTACIHLAAVDQMIAEECDLSLVELYSGLLAATSTFTCVLNLCMTKTHHKHPCLCVSCSCHSTTTYPTVTHKVFVKYLP